MEMSQLLTQPPEILHNILQQVDPEDLASLSKTCQTLRHFIQNDRLLWKSQYLRHFDYPHRKYKGSEPDWPKDLHDLVAVKKILESDDTELKKDSIDFVATHALALLENTAVTADKPSLNTAFLTRQFVSPRNIDNFLCRSSLFEQAGASTRKPASTHTSRQLSARLHVLYGISVESPRRFVRPVHPFARSRVYDLRRYNDGNMWGPFLDDGSGGTDWEKVEAILVVLGYNLRVFCERMSGRVGPFWDEAWAGTAEGSFISPPRLSDELPLALEAQDPYGVTGTWMRIVCFLDYTDLYALNFESASIPLSQDRPPVDTQEAIRFITIKLHITRIEEAGPEDDPSLPVVHFTGTSRSMYMSWDPNANSRIRDMLTWRSSGTVRKTRAGAIRWTSFSIYHGEERWRSEGVQIGGLRSARGVLGTWFDKDYDIHGPAGPTAFWKLSDEIVEDKPRILSEGIQVVFL